MECSIIMRYGIQRFNNDGRVWGRQHSDVGGVG